MTDIVERLERVDASLAKQLSESIAKNAKLAAENADLRIAVESARETAFEQAAQICDHWIGTFQEADIQCRSARDYAVDAVEDIAEAIRTPKTREAILSIPSTEGR